MNFIEWAKHQDPEGLPLAAATRLSNKQTQQSIERIEIMIEEILRMKSIIQVSELNAQI